MERSRIYIDESGDPGLRKCSSKHFVIAAVVFKNQKDADLLSDAILDYLNSIDWNKDYELKFCKTRKEVIEAVLKLSVKYDFEIHASVLNKEKFDFSKYKINGDNAMYVFVLINLLKRLEVMNSVITIDGVRSSVASRKMCLSLKKNLGKKLMVGTAIEFFDSKKIRLLQLADLISGSIRHSLFNNKNSDDFLKIITKKRTIDIEFIE